MDGQFYPITSVTQDGVEITTSIQKKLLPNYFSADFMIGENNRLINFDEVLSETLFSNWCLIQEELDIVHNTALYCLSRVEMPVDMKCAFLIEAFIGVGEIIQSKKSEFVLPKRKSREESQLGLDLKYIISHYGQEIFRGEYQKDLEGFVQILVNSRNRIAHIKSKQNRKFLNGDESVLYLHKLSLMYRIILLDLLDIPLNRYKERLSNRIVNETRFSNIFIEKRVSSRLESLERSGLFLFAAFLYLLQNSQNSKLIFLCKVVI